MESARPSMTFPNSGPGRFAQRFMKAVPSATDLARNTLAGAGVAMATEPAVVSGPPAGEPVPTISGLRYQYNQLKSRPHSLTVAEVEELESLLEGDEG